MVETRQWDFQLRQGNRMGEKRCIGVIEDARWQEKPALTLNQSIPPAVKDTTAYRTAWRGRMKGRDNDNLKDSAMI